MTMNICLSSDNNFAQYLATTITSILVNANEDDNINFHIIAWDISDENKNKLLLLKEIKDFSIKFYDPIDIEKYTSWINMNKCKWYTNPAVFFRLSAPKLFSDIDKILYLDCDMIITKSLRELFEIDISNYMAIVVDDIIWNYRRKNPNKFGVNTHDFLLSIGLDDDTHYFNTGFLFINNKLWREIDIDKQFEDFQLKYYEYIRYPDQDMLNYVLRDKVKYIESKWNFAPYLDKDYYPVFPKVEDLCIIHYAASKPWNPKCTDKLYIDEFWKYFFLTPWFKENPSKYINIIVDQKINSYDKMITGKINQVKNINISSLKITNRYSIADFLLSLSENNNYFYITILGIKITSKKKKLDNNFSYYKKTDLLFSIYENNKYKRITLFGIKITVKR